jgi:hypothetical protein
MVVAAVGLLALSSARPARAGGGPPDLRPDTPTYTYLPANSFMNNPAGWYLIVNVRNIGGSDVNRPFRVKVILGGTVEMNETYTWIPLAAGAGRGTLIRITGCTPGGVLYSTVYVDMDNNIDESSESNNQRNGQHTC